MPGVKDEYKPDAMYPGFVQNETEVSKTVFKRY